MLFIGFFLKVGISTPLFSGFYPYLSVWDSQITLAMDSHLHPLHGSWLDVDGFLVIVMTFELCGPSIAVFEVYLFIFVLRGCSG